MDATDDLRQLGLRATLPRLKVLEVLRGSSQRHLSAEDVHRQLLLSESEVGLATVYRVLSQLEQAGILTRTNFDTGRAVFELNDHAHHDHLVCVLCGKVEEFEDKAIEQRQAAIAAERGFQLTEHRLSLYGRCAACRQAADHGGHGRA